MKQGLEILTPKIFELIDRADDVANDGAKHGVVDSVFKPLGQTQVPAIRQKGFGVALRSLPQWSAAIQKCRRDAGAHIPDDFLGHSVESAFLKDCSIRQLLHSAHRIGQGF